MSTSNSSSCCCVGGPRAQATGWCAGAACWRACIPCCWAGRVTVCLPHAPPPPCSDVGTDFKLYWSVTPNNDTWSTLTIAMSATSDGYVSGAGERGRARGMLPAAASHARARARARPQSQLPPAARY